MKENDFLEMLKDMLKENLGFDNIDEIHVSQTGIIIKFKKKESFLIQVTKLK